MFKFLSSKEAAKFDRLKAKEKSMAQNESVTNTKITHEIRKIYSFSFNKCGWSSSGAVAGKICTRPINVVPNDIVRLVDFDNRKFKVAAIKYIDDKKIEIDIWGLNA